MTIVSTIVGKNPLEKWSSPHSQEKSPKSSSWVDLKNDRMISVRSKGKSKITVIQIYVPTTNAKEDEVD